MCAIWLETCVVSLLVILVYLFSITVAADYDADYTPTPANGIRNEINATTRELRFSGGVVTLNIIFDIVVDDTPEPREEFFLFLEGARRAFILTPVISVTILDDGGDREFHADYTRLFLIVI